MDFTNIDWPSCSPKLFALWENQTEIYLITAKNFLK